jgi:uncharacterized protein (DUF885 family)
MLHFLTIATLFFTLLVTLVGCSPPAEEQTELSASGANQIDATVRLNAWLDDEFAEYLDFSPLAKTRLGDKSDYGDLDDVSMVASNKILDWRRASVAEMTSRFQRDQLDAEGQLSWDLWVYLLARDEAAEPYKWHHFIFGRRGPHTGLPNSLINYHKVDSAADMDAYISRLNQSGRYLAQYLERAMTSAAKDIRAPYFDYEIAASHIDRVLTGAPFSDDGTSAIWQDITGKITVLESQGKIEAEQASAYRVAAEQALLNVTKPAYKAIQKWLQADLANVPANATGASALPDGKAYYDQALVKMTTLPLSSDEIHQTGLAEVARLQAEMITIKNKVGFEGSLQEFFVFMREDPQFYFPNTDDGREAYLAMARNYLGKMQTQLPTYFGLLPKSDLEVRQVEEFRAEAGGAAHYMRGTADGARPGVFYVHLADMNAISKYRLENLAFHEGLPGHHMQISIQQELDNVPRFRTYHGYTAYSEGWGLYSEFLGKEMGFYVEPYNDFGRLTGEIWRAIRLVVDTGIHAKAWTEDEAIQYALVNSPRPEAAVRSEVRRYFNNPAQATAYKIGMLKILELRQRAKDELGDAFDYRQFHDAVLGSGPLPLAILEQKIVAWIATVKQRT